MKNLNYFMVVIIAIIILSCKPTDPNEKKINEIIEQMTLDEKLAFIGGYNSFYIRGIERLEIPEIRFADGPTGVRNYGPSTSYPASICLSASFNKQLAYNVGKAIGSEARAKNVHVMLGPAMNIHRSPFCGRNFEYLGEDPYLAGQIAAQYTKGMQNEGVMASAKHYAANNQDYNRHKVSSDMDERTLHEIYLPAFKTTVQEGEVATVMTSYNLVNGIHASENDELINQILKKDWGFKGFVMSDWVSTYDGIACAKGGLDLEMPSGIMMNPDTLKTAIEKGIIDEDIIDDKVRRILREYMRFGLIENPDISKGYLLDSVFVRNIAIDAAREGTVLLKNQDSILPLDRKKYKKIAVIGPNGHPAVTGGGGSSFVNPLHPMSYFEALKQIADSDVIVTYDPGVYTGVRLPDGYFKNSDFYIYEKNERIKGIRAEFFGNTELKGNAIYSHVYENLNLESKDMEFEKVPKQNFSIRFTCFFKPSKSGIYRFGVSGDDGYRLSIDGRKVITLWQNQGETIRQYEESFIAGREYRIELDYFQSGGDAVIRFASDKRELKGMQPADYIAHAVNLAKTVDLVVLCVGFSRETEGEGFDRTFELPYNQSELITKVAEANPNNVVVLNAGGNVDMSKWLDKTKGLIHSWYPGQEGSLAVAEILFGITNPSGKLPVSFEARLEDNPTFNSYWDNDSNLKVTYSEGIFLGYRYYDKSNVKPLFPFGFGLSYTSFSFSNLVINKKEFMSDDIISVKIDVTNTGAYDGSEVLQLYVADKKASLPRPIKELKDFEKVSLKKGETKTVEFLLDKNAFSFYNPEEKEWVEEQGIFTVLVGNSSTNIVAQEDITLIQD